MVFYDTPSMRIMCNIFEINNDEGIEKAHYGIIVIVSLCEMDA